MNKDMTNIDELFKQKLSEHKVQGDEDAAWLKMKALLDEKMPENGIVYFRWKKPAYFLGAILLIAAMCAGTYEMFLANRDLKNETSTIVSKPSNKLGTSETPQADTSKVKQLQESDQITAENNKAHNGNINSKLLVKSNKTNQEQFANPQQNNPSISTQRNLTQIQKQLFAADNQNEINSQGDKGGKQATSIIAESNNSAKAKMHSALNENTTEGTLDNGGTSMDNGRNDQSKSKNTFNSVASQGKNTNKKSSVSSPIDNSKTNQSSSGHLVNNTSKYVEKQAKNDETAPTKNDTIASITVVTKESVTKTFPRQKQFISDTVSKGNVVLTQNEVKAEDVHSVPAQKETPSTQGKNQKNSADRAFSANQSTKNAQQSKGVLASKAPSKSESNPAAQSKTTSKVDKKSSWLSNIRLSDKINSAKKDLSNANFYAGFNVGFNQSINNANSFMGVQFGPTGELVFNQHWSLFGALKYFNRGGGTKTVSDNYIKESSGASPDSIIGANRFYTVFTDSTNRFFNFSTLHSFELPLTLRYAFKKFYLMTGINIAYYLGVNVEEVEKKYNQVRAHTVSTNLTKPILMDNSPQVRASDFASKLGLGYIFGIGYRITPAWHSDLRIVNTFWDNASGDGAKKLSKEFYRIPSVQISVGYQFNRGKTKPTYGPTDQH